MKKIRLDEDDWFFISFLGAMVGGAIWALMFLTGYFP